jgi:aspartate/methionine/tyrosine aminotransferase
MARSLNKFAHNGIIALTQQAADYDLAESVGPDLRLRDLMDADLGQLGDLPLAYGSAPGRLDLRQAIAAMHGASAEEVVVTVGGMHALYLIAAITCEKGDEVVLTAPHFPNTRTVFEAAGAEVKTLALSFDEGYRLAAPALHGALSPRTRIVCLASPQNPSGVIIPTETISSIVRRMQQICPDAYLVLDETYREAVYGTNAVMPSPAYISPRIVSCASLSKCHGAPGLRLGWAITRDPALRQQLVLGKFNSVISNSAIDEALALRVLERRDTILDARRQSLSEGLGAVADWVAKEGALVEWVRPDAGALCCVRLRPSAFDDAAVGRFYGELGRDGVRVANGDWFGESPRVFRLGFGLLATAELETALAHLSGALHRARGAAA